MPSPFRRPRSRRGWLIALAGAVTVAVAAFLVAYFVVFPTDSPDRFALTDDTNAAPPPAPASAEDSGGNWKIAAGSQAGYRVREKLAFLSAKNDAVGRTSQITGTATLTDTAVTAASFEIDVSTLKSDRDMRDQRIHSIGLESDRFPKAAFKLATPVDLPSTFASGRVVHLKVTGDFTIHGVTKQHTIPVDMRLSSSGLEATGSLTFPWKEFDMSPPNVGGFVKVEDEATMEFDLKLKEG